MLESLFSPKSVAVIGASSTPGKVGHVILSNLIKGGFQGPIVPVNPSVDEILGARCYSTIKEYGDEVELSVIVRPRQHAEEAVRDSLAAGCRSIILISSGFKEADEAGAELETKIASLCQSRGVRLLGPNCLGIINTEGKINVSFGGNMPYKGGISVISQSGAICTAILDQAAARHMGLAKLVSMGNKADVSEVDLLRFMARDKQTKVVAGYLEDIRSGDDFVKAAEEASSSKPVIILKAGTTEAGLKAAASHTGVLAGTDTAYGAAFKRSGVIRADTFQDLFDYASAFSLQPLPKGKRVLIITNAGGPGTLVADAVEKAGLEVAVLDRNISSSLREKLPDVASTGNPIDVLGDADPERYAEAIRAAQDDDSVDAVIVILTPQAMTRPAETALAIAAQITGQKPVFASFMGGEGVMPGRAELNEAGLPDYDSPERAVAVIKAMHEYASWKQRPPRVVTRFPVNRRRVERIITRNQRTNRLHLGEVKSKSILEAYGFKIPEGHLAATREEAVEIAKRFGFPAAMKIVSADVIHKSDLGGVRLNLATVDAVRDAYDLMMIRIREKAPQARIEGVYVEEMIDPGMEVIIGMNRDPQFGPMLMFGLGGIFVEVMKDVTFHLAPITSEEAKQMLLSTRSYEIMEGKRGQQGVDLEAIANGLQRISQLTTDFPQIEELDINPFIVGGIGSEPVVADARMTLSKLI